MVMSSGQKWKEQRKFSLEILREFGFGKPSLETQIHKEIEYLIETIKKQNGEKIDICKPLQTVVTNVICIVTLGKRIAYENPLLQECLRKSNDIAFQLGNTSFINFFPWLRHLPSDPFKFKKLVRDFDFFKNNLIQPSVQEHKENFDPENIYDFTSAYLKEIQIRKKSAKESSINETNLIQCINDLFIAASETTSTAILWTILYFLHYPDVCEKCYQELQGAVGSERLPSIKDKANMPYNVAVYMEILRHVNIVPLSVPRATAQDCVFHGYFIPKGTFIIPNLDSIFDDDQVWGDVKYFDLKGF